MASWEPKQLRLATPHGTARHVGRAGECDLAEQRPARHSGRCTVERRLG
jgi:hypothetical protein